jgi:Ca2+-transporting ATPase
MISGDHPDTALAIAREAGIDTTGGVMLGQQLQTDEHLNEAVQRCNVFARTSPSQKLRLVEALKNAGEIVGMTGDGVNDALALKAAHIGVAMGARGTDVAREAASLVLLNDEFASLVDAVRLGRRIYENLRHAVQYLLAVHIPIGGMGLLPVLLGWPIMFFPLHVLFLEFVIDPASCLVFEADAEDERVMRRPPRDPRERLIARQHLAQSLGLGTVALAMTFAVYAVALTVFSTETARTLAFFSIVCGNLMLIHLHRAPRFLAKSRPANWPFWWIATSALSVLLLIIHVPALARLFQFAAPPLWSLLVLLLITVFATSALEKALTSRLKRQLAAQVLGRSASNR